MSPEYQRLEGVFDATPLPRSLRQEVQDFDMSICVMELVDNAVDATTGRAEPLIIIQLDVDAEGGPELVFEDNGRGMSLKELKHYFRVSFTTSRIPEIDRESNPGVLPIKHFFNCKLNRYGRGAAAVVYFGDLAEIESFKAPTDPKEPSKAYKVVYDYGSQIDAQSWKLDLYGKDQEVVEEELDGWTCIKIRQLVRKQLDDLQDVAKLKQLARRLSQVYYWYICGFPEALWDKLPKEMTQGCERPTGGLRIVLRAKSRDGIFFEADLHRDTLQSGSEYESALQRVLRKFVAMMGANPLLGPAITCIRYEMERVLSMRQPNLDLHASASKKAPPPAGASGSGGAGARRSGRPPLGPRPAAGAGGSGGSSAGPAVAPGGEAIEVINELSDYKQRPADSPCDFVIMWLYFPYDSSARTKPQGEDDEELFMFPFWSGKGMVKSKLHFGFPRIHQAAVELARRHQDAQKHVHKLADSGRLVGLLLVSPDALAHQHKSDFEGKAYELFLNAGFPAKSFVPSSPNVSRLLTYCFANTPNPTDTEAGPSTGAGSSRTQRQRRSSGVSAASPLRVPPLPSTDGWYEDAQGGWAAQQLLEAFLTWFKLDDDGHLVKPEIMELVDQIVEPVGFNLEKLGMVSCSKQFLYGEGGHPLEAGEMVIMGDPLKIHGRNNDDGSSAAAGGSTAATPAAAGGGGGRIRRMAFNARLVELFYETGSDRANQLFAVVRPWRPRWAPLAAAQSESIMEFQPILHLDQGGKDRGARRNAQRSKVTAWEAFLPHRLALVPDEQAGGPLGGVYDTNHRLNTVTVVLARHPSPSSGAAGGEAGSGGGKRKGGPKAASAGAGAAGGSLLEADMSKTQSHFPKYRAKVQLFVEAKDEGSAQGWRELGSFDASSGSGAGRFTFSGFGRLVRAPGEFRLRFEVEEEEFKLLEEGRDLTHVFTVRSGHPVAMAAFFTPTATATTASSSNEAPQPLARDPTVRLGEPLPDVAVQLLDGAGGRMAFSAELMDRLRLPLDFRAKHPGAAGTPGGTSSILADGNPLIVTADVHNGDRLPLKLKFRSRTGSVPGGGGRPVGVSFSADNRTMFLSGLQVEPLALKQSGVEAAAGGKSRTAMIPSVTVRLGLVLRPVAPGNVHLSTAEPGAAAAATAAAEADGAGGSAAASEGAAAGSGGGSGSLQLLLVSGPPARLGVESGNWLNGREANPLELSQGSELDNDLVIRVEDAQGNPYYMMPGAGHGAGRPVRPRVELRCALPHGVNSRAGALPPVLVRKQGGGGGGGGGANAGAGGAGRSNRGAGAVSEFVEATEFETDSSGNLLVIPGSHIRARGRPGEVGTISASLLGAPPARGAAGGSDATAPSAHLGPGFVQIRRVVLGVEEDPEAGVMATAAAGAAASFAAGAGASPDTPQRLLLSRHVRDYVVDGTVKRRARNLKDMVESAFERRVEYTSSGPREIFIRPNGSVLPSRRDAEAVVKEAVAAAGGAPIVYEQCFVLRPGQTVLEGLMVSLSDEKDDEVDELMRADVKVFIGSREAFSAATRTRFEGGRMPLPELRFFLGDFTGGVNGTVAVQVRDCEPRGSGGGGGGGGGGGSASGGRAGSFVYGTFYVRQEPYPVALRLAPIVCALLTDRAAVVEPAPPPPGTNQQRQQPQEGVLQGPAGAGDGGGASSSRHSPAPPSSTQLLHLVPHGGIGGGAGGSAAQRGQVAVVDAAALMARGFRLAPGQNVAVQAGSSLEIPLVAVDQFGLPVPLSPALAQHIAAHLTATLEQPGSSETNNPRGAGGGGGAGGSGGSTARGRSGSGQRQAVSRPCAVRDWRWPEADQGAAGGAAGGVRAARATADRVAARPLPACSFQVDLAQVQGAGVLTLSFTGDGAQEGGGPALSALHLEVPVQVTHGPVDPAGYDLTVSEPAGVQAQLLDEAPDRTKNFEDALPLPEKCGRMYAAEVMEQTELRLAVRLMDSQGCLVDEAGTFKITHLLPLPVPERVEQSPEREPPPHWRLVEEEVRVAGGRLVVPHRVGAGPLWRVAPLLLLLRPASENFRRADPLAVFLNVKAGRYPVEPLELVRWGASEHSQQQPNRGDDESTDDQTAVTAASTSAAKRRRRGRHLELTLTNEDPAQEGEGAGPGPSSGGGGKPLPCIPAFTVEVHSADGAKLEGSELRPLRLHYEREVEVEGASQWVEDTSQPVTQLQPTDGGGPLFRAAAGQVPLPKRCGVNWRLVAVYEDPRVIMPGHRLAPLVITALLVHPAPPHRISLDPESEAALGSVEARGRAVVVSEQGLREANIPQLKGRLTDRWGNPSPPASPETVLIFKIREASRNPPPAAASTSTTPSPSFEPRVLDECPVDPSDGSFTMPLTPLIGPNHALLAAGQDYEVVLEVDEEEQAGEGAGQEEGGRVAPVLLKTLYVSLWGDSAKLREKRDKLRGQVVSREAELSDASELLEQRRREVGSVRAEQAACMQRLGVQPQGGQAAGAAAAAAADGGAPAGLEEVVHAIEAEVAAVQTQIAQALGPPNFEDAALARYHGQRPSVCIMPYRATRDAEYVYGRLQRMAAACEGVQGAFGPAVMLGAAERADVATALSSLAGARQERIVFVAGAEAATVVKNALRGMRPGGTVINLHNPDVHFRFELEPAEVDTSHPQMLLRKRQLVQQFAHVLQMDIPPGPGAQDACRRRDEEGFIGFAVNLVHLPPQLRDVRVQLRGRGQATLRQTALNYVFGNALVFETGRHIEAFRQRCEANNIRLQHQCIAVDGVGGYNLGDVGRVPSVRHRGESFGERPVPHVRFSGLPLADVTALSADGSAAGALDLRLRAQQLRARSLQAHQAALQDLPSRLPDLARDLRARQQLVDEQQAQLDQLQATRGPEVENLRQEIRQCEEELRKVVERELAAQQQQQQQGQGGTQGGGAPQQGAHRQGGGRFGHGAGAAGGREGAATGGNAGAGAGAASPRAAGTPSPATSRGAAARQSGGNGAVTGEARVGGGEEQQTPTKRQRR